MKKISILWVIVVLLFLCGCQSTNSLKAMYNFENSPFTVDRGNTAETVSFPVVDNETPWEQLITKEVDIHEFGEFMAVNGGHNAVFNMSDFAVHFPIECLRQMTETTRYTIYKVKQGGLIFIFYNLYDPDDLNTAYIRGWCYLRELFSWADFQSLTEEESTIDDLIAIDKDAQLHENIAITHTAWLKNKWNNNDDEVFTGYIYAYYYLKDGIGCFEFEEKNGEFRLTDMEFYEDFELPCNESRYVPCYAHLLDIDRID